MPLSPEELEAVSTPPPDPHMSMDMATRQDPDRSAQVYSIADKNELPTTVVDTNLEEFQRLERVQEADKARMGPNVLDLLNNPDKAPIVQDDLDNLMSTEEAMTPSLIDDILGVAHAGVLDIGTGLAGLLQFEAENRRLPGDFFGLGPRINVGETPESRFFSEVALSGRSKAEEVFPQIENEMARSAVSGARSAVNFLTLMTATRGQALIPMALQQGGMSYSIGREKGLEAPAAARYGAIQGGIEYLTEKIPMNRLLGDLAEGTGFFRTLRNQLLTELPTEQVATVFQDLNDWATLPENADKPFSAYLEERPNAALQTAIATAVGTSIQTSAVHTVNKLVGGEPDAVVQQLVSDSETLAISELEQERLDRIITLGQESKVSERQADVYKDFLAGAGSQQSVFVPVDVLNEIEGLPETFTEQMDGLGGDIEIPMDIFMTEIINNQELMTALRPHMKLGADQLSATEIEQGVDMTTRRLLERAQAAADIKTEADTIYEGIRQQLIDTGRVTQSEASLSAKLYPAIATIMADRYGISPQEVFDRMGLTIEGGQGTVPASDARVLRQTYEAFRGEHGPITVNGELQTRQGSVTFSGPESARGYATEPNRRDDTVVDPRVISANVTIDNPVMNDPDDPFLEFTALEEALGFEQARDIFLENREYIEETSNWQEFQEENPGVEMQDMTEEQWRQMYTQAFPVFDSHDVVAAMREAGYDGAVHGGYGEFHEPEYRIFNPANVEVTNVEELNKEARLARAEAQGFDTSTVWYHGTDQDFESFSGMTFVTEHQGEASAYANTRAFRGNLRRDEFFDRVTEGELGADEFGSVPYTGIVDDIDGEGVWATDNGVVRVTGEGNNRTIEYMSNAVVGENYTGTHVDIIEGESDAYQEAVEMAGLQPQADVSPQVMPVYIRDGKFKELKPLEANILGARLRDDMTESETAKYEKLLSEIEQWKADGFIGISTQSDDLGFGGISDEAPPQQRIIFDPKNIRSVNAKFLDSDSTKVLAQEQIDKRRSMVEKLRECVAK